jgi:hypothetical protein
VSKGQVEQLNLNTADRRLYSSYVQSFRFAAADSATGAESQKAISRVMVRGLVAAIIGPQLVLWARAFNIASGSLHNLMALAGRTLR